jgi:hypothetical protein
MTEDDVEAGWYDEGNGEERYWDGSDWSDQYRPIERSGGPTAVSDEGSVDTRVEYKILTQKDRFFGGKFDPLKLEEALNSYAHEGWTVTGIATADIPSFGGSRQELVVVMSRPR